MRARCGNARSHVVERHLPDAGVGVFRQQVGEALFPHAGKFDGGAGNIAVPGIAVFERKFFRQVESLGTVDIEMGFEIVNIRADFGIVAQGQEPAGGGYAARIPGGCGEPQTIGFPTFHFQANKFGGCKNLVLKDPVELDAVNQWASPRCQFQIAEVDRLEISIKIA